VGGARVGDMRGADTVTIGCPHGAFSRPETCSHCAGVPARKVDLVAGEVVVDGQPTGRHPDGELVSQRTRDQRRRGGRR